MTTGSCHYIAILVFIGDYRSDSLKDRDAFSLAAKINVSYGSISYYTVGSHCSQENAFVED